MNHPDPAPLYRQAVDDNPIERLQPPLVTIAGPARRLHLNLALGKELSSDVDDALAVLRDAGLVGADD